MDRGYYEESGCSGRVIRQRLKTVLVSHIERRQSWDISCNVVLCQYKIENKEKNKTKCSLKKVRNIVTDVG